MKVIASFPETCRTHLLDPEVLASLLQLPKAQDQVLLLNGEWRDVWALQLQQQQPLSHQSACMGAMTLGHDAMSRRTSCKDQTNLCLWLAILVHPLLVD